LRLGMVLSDVCGGDERLGNRDLNTTTQSM